MAKIRFTGDVMSGSKIDAFCKTENGYDYAPLFKGVKKLLADCDYSVVNLETPIAESCDFTKERYQFNTPEAYLQELIGCGAGLYCLANNHCMDRDFKGIEGTVSAMKRYGLDYVGICDCEEDAKKVFVKEIDGIRVGFLNYTYGTNAFHHHTFLGDKKWAVRMLQPEETLPGAMELLKPNEGIAEDYTRVYVTEKEKYERITEPFFERIQKEIEALKKVSDFVVAVIHSGGQYNDEPDLFTIEINKRILSAGADIVVGHHPHIIQRSEWVDGKFCAYSLGNFLYMYDRDREYEVEPRFSVLLDLTLQKQGGRVEISMLSFKICHTKGEGTETATKLSVCDGDEFPQAVDAYEEYLENPSEELKKEILYFANRFIGKEDYYTEVQAEYEIPVQK